MDFVSSPPVRDDFQDRSERERPRCLSLATPSSSSSVSVKRLLTPGTPLPDRADLRIIVGDVGAVLFDFDGTLTASPGDRAQRCRKQVELRERAPLLAPRLRALRDAGLVLGIISKSSEATIGGALDGAGLAGFFDGPLLARAVGLEGKAGFITDLVGRGSLRDITDEKQVLLVDDDLRELERARARNIQTYAAPTEGGLREEDFDAIFDGLGLQPEKLVASRADSNGSSTTATSSTLPPSPISQLSPAGRLSAAEPVKAGSEAAGSGANARSGAASSPPLHRARKAAALVAKAHTLPELGIAAGDAAASDNAELSSANGGSAPPRGLSRHEDPRSTSAATALW